MGLFNILPESFVTVFKTNNKEANFELGDYAYDIQKLRLEGYLPAARETDIDELIEKNEDQEGFESINELLDETFSAE